ncbi:hypothetical protein GF382_00370, partial [Candidatus Falkowbacteria bacterium]|nr:hypothetical protein [Candidatus Falkowbacteria bacterium]
MRFKNSFKKMIEYGIYALALLLPFQTRLILRPGNFGSGSLEYLTISLYAVDILIIFLLLLFLIDKIRNSQIQIPKSKFIYLIILFDLALFVSIFYSPDKL